MTRSSPSAHYDEYTLIIDGMHGGYFSSPADARKRVRRIKAFRKNRGLKEKLRYEIYREPFNGPVSKIDSGEI